jgi:hypothetical protein
MKILARILVASWLIPGFLFDMGVGILFLGDEFGIDQSYGETLFSYARSCPHWYAVPFMLSVWICAIPAGVVCVALLIGSLLGIVYVIMNLGAMILAFPFSGKIEWGLPFKD